MITLAFVNWIKTKEYLVMFGCLHHLAKFSQVKPWTLTAQYDVIFCPFFMKPTFSCISCLPLSKDTKKLGKIWKKNWLITLPFPSYFLLKFITSFLYKIIKKSRDKIKVRNSPQLILEAKPLISLCLRPTSTSLKTTFFFVWLVWT